MRTTITVREIAERLGICEETVYDMLRSRTIPNLRYGRRFIISRVAYEKWEATIGEAIPVAASREPKPIDSDRSNTRKTTPPKAA